MNIRIVCCALILGGLLAGTASSTPSMAQTRESATKNATVNTNMTPTKHRHWRHRGGRHPHYGSRRVRSHIHTPQ